MDSNAKTTAQAEKLNGLFVRGVVMSSVAKALKRKDGTGMFVIAKHELALQPCTSGAESSQVCGVPCAIVAQPVSGARERF